MEAANKQESTSVYILYKPEQIEEANHFRLTEGCTILVLDFWCEQELARQGIPFVSSKEYVPKGAELGEALHTVETIAREWFTMPQMAFFTHQNLLVGEVFEPMVDFYVGRVLFNVITFEHFFSKHASVKKVVVPGIASKEVDTTGPLAPFEIRAISDAARAVAEAKHIAFLPVGEAPTPVVRNIYPSGGWVPVLLAVSNFCIRLLPGKPIKIFASEYWSHIAPFMEQMSDVELVLMDKKEARVIPLREMIRKRMRFVHPLDVVDRTIRKTAAAKQKEYSAQWPSAKQAVSTMPQFVYNSVAWWSAVEAGFDHLVEVYAERIVADYEALERIMRKEKTSKVLLRASIGGRQQHFFIMTQVAKKLGIPSIELQHANEIVDPNTVHSRLAASYLAAYGLGTRSVLVQNHQYAPERIVPVGSPRFDAYLAQTVTETQKELKIRSLGLDPKKPIVFVGMPAETTDLYFIHFSAYEIEDFMQSLVQLCQEVPDIQLILKFRPGNLTEERKSHYRGLFTTGTVALVDREDPYLLMQLSTLVFAGNSTLIYEAMIAQKPIVMCPLKPHDTYFLDRHKNILPYVASAGSLTELTKRIIEDVPFRAGLVENTKDFIAKEYLFDGGASERTVTLLRDSKLQSL